MRSEATASARSQPVSAMTAAAISTATEPSASLMTSSNAARVFRLPPEMRDSSPIETALPASPTTPKTTIAPEATADGSISRRIASASTNPPTASSTAACAAAASTSAGHLDRQDGPGDAQHDRQRTAVPGAGQAVIVPGPGVALLPAAPVSRAHATAARGAVPEAGHSAAAAPVAASTLSAARSRSISSGRVSA